MNTVMDKTKRVRTYSRVSEVAARILGLQIRRSRKRRNIAAQEVAERANISRTTLQKIEKGELTTEIGLVFEVATIVGVILFDEVPDNLRLHEARLVDYLALMPKRASPPPEVDDDF